MNWKHAYSKQYKDGTLQWCGDLPDYDVAILVYSDGYFHIDTFIYGDGEAELEESFANDFYWCYIEAPETGTEGRGVTENKTGMMTLPIDYANRALAKEEMLDELVEREIIEVYQLEEIAEGNPFWMNALKLENELE